MCKPSILSFCDLSRDQPRIKKVGVGGGGGGGRGGGGLGSLEWAVCEEDDCCARAFVLLLFVCHSHTHTKDPTVSIL